MPLPVPPSLGAFSLSRCFKRLAAAWFAVNAAALTAGGPFNTTEYAAALPSWLWVAGTAGVFLLLSLPALRSRHPLDDYYLLGGSLLYGVGLVGSYTGAASYGFVGVVLLALALLWYPLLKQPDFHPFPFSMPRKAALIGTAVCGVLLAAVTGTVTCLRYANYQSPNYDFGLFCQMFHYLKETLLPLTTSERNQLLSHFAVHLSPIWYVLLPAYCLFPSPYTLQIAQAVVLALGLIPLYLICRKRGLSPKATLAFSGLYALYPALSTGAFFDIHENCFLPPLLLTLFACYEYGKYKGLFLAAAGVLLVKEDAAVYLLFFALFLFFSEKERRRALWLAGMGIGYFLLAILWLQWQGEGAMFGRYDNLTGTEGLLSLPDTLLRNPGFFLTQLFHTDSGDGGKLLYLFQLLVPLAGLPVLARRPGRLLLLAPLLLNLLTQYRYQYDIGFQYSFGIAAFLFYAAVLNTSELPPRWRPRLLLYAGAACLLLFQTAVLPFLNNQVALVRENAALNAQLDEAMDAVPEGASVTASTMFVPHLSQRDVLYELTYHPTPDTDYLVLDLRPAYQSESMAEAAPFLEAGYEVVACWEDAAAILRAPAEG